jgi:hypothetical protein
MAYPAAINQWRRQPAVKANQRNGNENIMKYGQPVGEIKPKLMQ